MAQIVSSVYDLQGLYDNFHDMNLREDLLRGIYSSDIEKPTEVQQLALMFCLQGYDVIANAPIGTGKTIALLIAILQKIDTTLENCQALIVVKNFTIASQIKYLLFQLSKFMDVDIFVYMPNHKSNSSHQIVITTPIHALHFVKTPDQSVGIKCLLLDDIENILTCKNTRLLEQLCHSLPCKVQKMLSTTILSKKAYQTCCSLMSNPIKILLENNKRHLDGIKQYYIAINEIWKLNTIRDLYETLPLNQIAIFCSCKCKVALISRELIRQNFTVVTAYENMHPLDHQIMLHTFCSGSARVLIITDYMARRILIPQVSLIINYDLPANPRNYLYRIGCVKRFGRKGMAINLISKKESKNLEKITKYFNTQIEEMPANILDLMY